MQTLNMIQSGVNKGKLLLLKQSGIKKTQAEWWTINFYSGDRFCFNITLKTKDLKSIINKNNFNKVPGGDNNTSWGYLVPIIKLIDFNNYGQNKS